VVIYVFSEEKCNNRPVEKDNALCGLLVFNEANSGNILIAFAPNTGKGKLFCIVWKKVVILHRQTLRSPQGSGVGDRTYKKDVVTAFYLRLIGISQVHL
jgi:hypothetical protein